MSSDKEEDVVVKKPDPYIKFERFARKIAKPHESLARQHFPGAKIQSPKKMDIRPSSTNFIPLNDAVAYKDDSCTCVVTLKRNNIVMVYDPEYEIIDPASNTPRLAYLGYYKEDLPDCGSEREVIFLHPNQKYILVSPVDIDRRVRLPTRKVTPKQEPIPSDEESGDEKSSWFF